MNDGPADDLEWRDDVEWPHVSYTTPTVDKYAFIRTIAASCAAVFTACSLVIQVCILLKG